MLLVSLGPDDPRPAPVSALPSQAVTRAPGNPPPAAPVQRPRRSRFPPRAAETLLPPAGRGSPRRTSASCRRPRPAPRPFWNRRGALSALPGNGAPPPPPSPGAAIFGRASPQAPPPQPARPAARHGPATAGRTKPPRPRALQEQPDGQEPPPPRAGLSGAVRHRAETKGEGRSAPVHRRPGPAPHRTAHTHAAPRGLLPGAAPGPAPRCHRPRPPPGHRRGRVSGRSQGTGRPPARAAAPPPGPRGAKHRLGAAARPEPLPPAGPGPAPAPPRCTCAPPAAGDTGPTQGRRAEAPRMRLRRGSEGGRSRCRPRYTRRGMNLPSPPQP